MTKPGGEEKGRSVVEKKKKRTERRGVLKNHVGKEGGEKRGGERVTFSRKERSKRKKKKGKGKQRSPKGGGKGREHPSVLKKKKRGKNHSKEGGRPSHSPHMEKRREKGREEFIHSTRGKGEKGWKKGRKKSS